MIEIDREKLKQSFSSLATEKALDDIIYEITENSDIIHQCEQCKIAFSSEENDVIIKDENEHLDFCCNNCQDEYYNRSDDEEHRLTKKQLGL